MMKINITHQIGRSAIQWSAETPCNSGTPTDHAVLGVKKSIKVWRHAGINT